jgi:hypothetical protein
MYYNRNNQVDSVSITGVNFTWKLPAITTGFPAIITITGGKNQYCKRDTTWAIGIQSSLDWYASIPSEVEFTDTTNMVLTLDTDLTTAEISEIQWTFLETGAVFTTTNTLLLLTGRETGPVDIRITDINGCTLRLETIVRIKDDETDLPFTLPNIMVSGSASNGIFKIAPAENVSDITAFSVYDRWGNLQYNVSNPVSPEQIWNGTCIGGNCPDGVYVFYLQLTDKRGVSRVFSGDITVLNR